MSDAVASTTLKLGLFNESYEMSGAVDGLLHDVGRFPQYYESGALKDTDSKEFTGYLDNVDPRLEQTKDYMNLAIQNLIECSDGITLTKEMKEEAKVKTLKQFK